MLNALPNNGLNAHLTALEAAGLTLNLASGRMEIPNSSFNYRTQLRL